MISSESQVELTTRRLFLRSLAMRDVVAFSILGVLCFPVLLALMPHLEQGREEARAAQAHIRTRVQAEELNSSLVSVNDVVELVGEKDPWGNAYRGTRLVDGKLRVLSAGGNGVFGSPIPDADDIYSDMPVSPVQKYGTLRNRQWCVAFGSMLVAWAALILCFAGVVR